MSGIKISAIVCTYNRCDLLREAVLSLFEQNLDKNAYEIVVVDNNSTDDTRFVIEEISRGKIPVVKYVRERRKGLSFARNTGAHVAKGEIIAYIDDDSTAEREWLKGFLDAYNDLPDAGVIGGMIKPVWLSEKPAWVTQKLEMCFGVLNYGDEIQALSFPKTPFGGNFSIKRDLCYELGGFCENLGRKGLYLISNEEVFLCRLVEQYKKKIYYTPKAIVYHRVLPERLNKRYLFKRAYAQGISNIIMERELNRGQNVSRLNDIRYLKNMMKCSIRHFLSGKNELLTEDLFTIFIILGKLGKSLR